MLRKLLITLGVLAVGVVALVIWNHYDVQAAGDAITFDPASLILRTPDARFASLKDFSYAPHYVEIDDPDLGPLRVHYVDEGPRDAHVILLLHGQATWSYSYRDMIPLFTNAGYRVIAPDLIGFGRSDKPADWNRHTFAKHIDWLDKTLAALEIDNATGFFFDWGGYFGLPVAVRNPDYFDRLVLNTTTVPRADSLFAAAWVAGWRRYAIVNDVFPISDMVQSMTERELDAGELAGLDAPYPDETYKAGPRRFPMMIPATPLHPAHGPNTETWGALKNWNKPTLTMVSQSIAERSFDPKDFHDQIPGTAGQAHQIYPEAGFFLIEENPAQQAAGVLRFIEN